MSKGIRKQIRHIRRGAAFTRDHIGLHRNHLNANGAGIMIDKNGQEHHF